MLGKLPGRCGNAASMFMLAPIALTEGRDCRPGGRWPIALRPAWVMSFCCVEQCDVLGRAWLKVCICMVQRASVFKKIAVNDKLQPGIGDKPSNVSGWFQKPYLCWQKRSCPGPLRTWSITTFNQTFQQYDTASIVKVSALPAVGRDISLSLVAAFTKHDDVCISQSKHIGCRIAATKVARAVVMLLSCFVSNLAVV